MPPKNTTLLKEAQQCHDRPHSGVAGTKPGTHGPRAVVGRASAQGSQSQSARPGQVPGRAGVDVPGFVRRGRLTGTEPGRRTRGVGAAQVSHMPTMERFPKGKQYAPADFSNVTEAWAPESWFFFVFRSFVPVWGPTHLTPLGFFGAWVPRLRGLFFGGMRARFVPGSAGCMP